MSKMVFSLLIIVGFILTVSEPVEALRKLSRQKANEWTRYQFNTIDVDKNGVFELADSLEPARQDMKNRGLKELDPEFVEVLTNYFNDQLTHYGDRDGNSDRKVTFDEFYRNWLRVNGYEV